MPPRPAISDVPVVCVTAIGTRHRSSRRHTVRLGHPRRGDGYYLFHCDAEWETVIDTWRATVADARAQAEYASAGAAATWQRAG